MQVTEVRLTRAPQEDSCLAYGSITLDGDFVVCGIRVLKTKDGKRFVGYPSKQNSRGEYKDVCFPMTRELREEIRKKVLEEYNRL